MNCSSKPQITVRPARQTDLPTASALILPFVVRGELLPRSAEELALLLPRAFVAELNDKAAGFAALEIYSRKISEIQCLSFEETPKGPEITQLLVRSCVQHAQEIGILEVMAIVATSLGEVLKTCGFDYALPNHKRAMFVRPQCANEHARMKFPSKVTIEDASIGDLTAVVEFLAPFAARRELVQRSPEVLAKLLPNGFLAKAEGRIVGFVALEIYSRKLSEIQCLSVDAAFRGQGIARQLVMLSVQRARENHVTETMAITAHEALLASCGFDYCLPGPKAALFYQLCKE